MRASSHFFRFPGQCASVRAIARGATILAGLVFALPLSATPSPAKPKVIVMTDGEIDDHSSMIRFLFYTCDVDVRARAFHKLKTKHPRDYERAVSKVVMYNICLQRRQSRPIARVAGSLDAQRGETVRLDGRATSDPDRNALSFKWWQYHEAGSVRARVEIADADSPTASFVVPDEPGRTLHLILEVTDDGAPALVGYQRVIVTIAR